MTKKQKRNCFRICGSIVLLIISYVFSKLNLQVVSIVMALIAYLVVGYDILFDSIHGIMNKQLFDEAFLMSVATIGAIALQDYKEACFVMLFYQIGELFQSIAIGKSRKSIVALMDIRPDYANLKTEQGFLQVDPSEVEVGSIIVVAPGEKVPIDGVVVKGSSSLNTTTLTGESLPFEVEEGTQVLSGCINNEGVLEIQTTKEFGQSTVSKIMDLVENASSLKSKSENFISKFAKYYTPIVCGLAFIVAIVIPSIIYIISKEITFSSWIYKGLSFLVISCPCALVVSIPLSFFAGLGGASKEGILIKGSSYLETLSQIKQIVFDKTGTLTYGKFEVEKIVGEEKILEIAAQAEIYSNHPIANSIKQAYNKPLKEELISDYKQYSGSGVVCKYNNKQVLVGNDKLLKEFNIVFEPTNQVGTIIYVCQESKYLGYLVINDKIKENAKEAIFSLKSTGVQNTIMLTGDNVLIANKVATTLGIQEVHSNLLPQDKVAEVEKILTNGKGKVAFVGDGLNDAPVLARVDLGIAMGALGSDGAIEASDVVLMNDDLAKLAKAVKISKRTIAIVNENVIFAITVKIITLLLSLLGISNMALAIFADVGVMVIAICNAIRALFVKRL